MPPRSCGCTPPGALGKRSCGTSCIAGVSPGTIGDDALAQVEDSTEAIDAFLQKKLAGWTGDRKQLQKVTAALAAGASPGQTSGTPWPGMRPEST